jgi:RimJ/RimL family protein N-acetyltransferase
MVLNSLRTEIRPISQDDFPAILEMYEEEDSNKFIPPLLNKSEEYYMDFLAKKIETNKSEVGFWTVYDLNNGKFIGTVNLNQFADTSMIHMGCHLKRDHWNLGFASELMQVIRDYGIHQKNLPEIYGIASPSHSVSRKLLEKINFIFQGEVMLKGEKIVLYKFEK